MSPEQRLWQTVVLKAVSAATAGDSCGVDARKARDEADAWIRDGRRDFRHVCALAGMDPDFVRDAYMAERIDADLLRSKEPREAAA